MRRFFSRIPLALLLLSLGLAQEANVVSIASGTEEAGVEYVCPMISDKDIRSKTPGFCPRCHMKLVPDIADPHEYFVHVESLPKILRPGAESQLLFRVGDPVTSRRTREFEVMHEKLYHLFIVSQDLQVFVHTHPDAGPDGVFRLKYRFPKAGYYRILSDFYPKGGTPQLIASSAFVPGPGFKLEPAKLDAALGPQKSENLGVELVTDPQEPLAGQKTLMFFRLKPNDGIEPYIGAMGHMMAASSDLIDMIHTHPIYTRDQADYKEIQFNLIFPRPGIYRVWVQFQRNGVVNTVAFNIPVHEL